MYACIPNIRGRYFVPLLLAEAVVMMVLCALCRDIAPKVHSADACNEDLSERPQCQAHGRMCQTASYKRYVGTHYRAARSKICVACNAYQDLKHRLLLGQSHAFNPAIR